MADDEARQDDDFLQQVVGGKYRLLGILARTGLGTYYRADDEGAGGTGAAATVFLLDPALAPDDDVRRRLLRRAESALEFQHPRALNVREVGLDPALGCVFFVCDAIQGTTLRDMMRTEGTLVLQRMAHLGVQVLEALEEAGRETLYHGDLRPELVIVHDGPTGREEAHVLGTGVARAVLSVLPDAAPRLRTDYSCPELGSGGRIDVRADLYALGVLLHEALTGHLPDPGPARAHAGAEGRGQGGAVVRGIAGAGGDGPLGGPAREVVLKAIALDPAQRYEDAAAFRIALARLAEAEGSPAGGGGTQSEGAREVRRSRMQYQATMTDLDHRDHAVQDLTVGRRRRERVKRVAVGLLLVGSVGYAVYALVLPADLFTFAPAEVPVEDENARRAAMPPGRDLLVLELESPLDEARVEASLAALGEREAGTALESLAVRSPRGEVRDRAFDLWRARGYHRAGGARLGMLQDLARSGRDLTERNATLLVGMLREEPAPDEELITALAWAEGPVWDVVVDRLGRPGDGAEARASALAAALPRDNALGTGLTALLRTGLAPADVVRRLVERRGHAWACGAGKELLAAEARRSLDGLSGLLASQDEDARAAAADVLAAAATPPCVARLIAMLDDPSLRVRIRALLGLGTTASPDAVWPLSLLLSRRETDAAVQDEARRTLRRIPEGEAAARLRERLAPARTPEERGVAVRGLGLVGGPAAVEGLVAALRDADARIRVLALDQLDALRREGRNRQALMNALGALRDVGRGDQVPQVRTAAARLYHELSGRDP